MFCLGQQDTIVHLKELILTDVSLQLFSKNINKIQLNDSVIQNANSLTTILNNNTGIYFKENGKGMVSSVSFRGTTAQQTAVIWNGININSQFNGQTDFNTINLSDFSEIIVRSGGGSVLFGSGAVGGSVHLNADVSFKEVQNNKLNVQYGSFETSLLHYGFQKATQKIIAKFDITRNQSENDYEYIGYTKKNENGQYENVSFTSVFGYKINHNNSIKLFSYLYDGERYLSGTISSISKNKYIDFNTRNLLEWQNTSVKNLLSKTKIAFLTEEYQYFENYETKNYTFSKAETFLVRNNLLFSLSNQIKLNSIVEFNNTTGSGSSIENNQRSIFSGSLLLSHNLTDKLTYEASVRTEKSDYKSPFLYNFSTKYTVNNWYAIRFNTSKNFRIPSFNDLYWEASGNPNLQPETSIQYEISQDFKVKRINFTVTAYQNKIDKMLRWLPNSSGLWIPENTDKVKIVGIEALAKFQGNIKKLNYQIQSVYSYTKSENETTKKQLIYVPYHKLVSSFGLNYNTISLIYQYVFNGQVFTSSDNKNKLPEYGISNVNLKWNLPFKLKSSIGFSISNIENKPYQNVLSRPQPGQNYMFNINLNF